MLSRTKLLYRLVEAMYSREEVDFKRGTFRVKGESVDIYQAQGDMAIRILFFGDEVEELQYFDALSGAILDYPEEVCIYPARSL